MNIPLFPLALFSTVLGLLAGSFLSMLIPRLHYQMPGIIGGRSKCPKCEHTLGPLELIPLFSYLIQKGRCRKCKAEIDFYYPLIELSSAITFLVLSLTNQNIYELLVLMVMFTILLFIFFYDLRYKEIHDAVMLPGIVLAFLGSFVIGDAQSSLLGGAVAFAFFAIQYFATRGKMIGSGDMRIGAFMGLFLGLELTLVALLLSYVIGSIVGVTLMALKLADRKTAVPLGPFLVVGTVLAFFWGEAIIGGYFNFM